MMREMKRQNVLLTQSNGNRVELKLVHLLDVERKVSVEWQQGRVKTTRIIRAKTEEVDGEQGRVKVLLSSVKGWAPIPIEKLCKQSALKGETHSV